MYVGYGCGFGKLADRATVLLEESPASSSACAFAGVDRTAKPRSRNRIDQRIFISGFSLVSRKSPARQELLLFRWSAGTFRGRTGTQSQPLSSPRHDRLDRSICRPLAPNTGTEGAHTCAAQLSSSLFPILKVVLDCSGRLVCQPVSHSRNEALGNLAPKL